MGVMKNSGDYELISASIITNDSTEIDIRYSIIDIAVYESIFDNCMSGNITLFETQNIQDLYNLGNGELIILEWKTSGMEESIRLLGEVYELTGPGAINDHTNAYTLQFSSSEFMKGTRNKIFNGFRDSFDSIVSNIFNRTRPDGVREDLKGLISEPTLGIEHIVFTGQTLWQGISMCASKSVSTNNRTGYLFYEDNQNFVFKSIESLISEDPKLEFSYINDSIYDNVNNAHEEMFRNIQDYEFVDSNKFIDDVIDGQYGSTWNFLDLHKKELRSYKIRARSQNSVAPIILKSNKFNESYDDKINLSYGFSQSSYENTKPYGVLKLLKQDTFAISIGIFGDSSIKSGMTCLASIPKFSSDSGSGNEVDSYSGKFLIGSIKHLMKQEGYSQRLLLMKDSFEESL